MAQRADIEQELGHKLVAKERMMEHKDDLLASQERQIKDLEDTFRDQLTSATTNMQRAVDGHDKMREVHPYLCNPTLCIRALLT